MDCHGESCSLLPRASMHNDCWCMFHTQVWNNVGHSNLQQTSVQLCGTGFLRSPSAIAGCSRLLTHDVVHRSSEQEQWKQVHKLTQICSSNTEIMRVHAELLNENQ
jgi:hypothetical protein